MSDFGVIISITKDVATTIAAVVAGCVAVVGLNTWRKQHYAKINYEQARRFLRSLFLARDMINSIRSPFISAGEFALAREEAGEIGNKGRSQDKNTNNDEALVYQRRWNIASESFREFEAELVEAEVVWGKSVIDAAEPFNQCRRSLFAGIQMYLRVKSHRRWGHPQDPGKAERYEKIVWKISDNPEEDEFSGKVNQAVDILEIFLRPYLKL